MQLGKICDVQSFEKFQMCCNLRNFFRQILIPRFSDLTKKCLLQLCLSVLNVIGVLSVLNTKITKKMHNNHKTLKAQNTKKIKNTQNRASKSCTSAQNFQEPVQNVYFLTLTKFIKFLHVFKPIPLGKIFSQKICLLNFFFTFRRSDSEYSDHSKH